MTNIDHANGGYERFTCDCEVCTGKKFAVQSEAELHVFVGNNTYSHKCEVREFENGVSFDAVIHWDVGFTSNARYRIYLDEVGKFIAWYDTERQQGYVA